MYGLTEQKPPPANGSFLTKILKVSFQLFESAKEVVRSLVHGSGARWLSSWASSRRFGT